MGLLKNDLLVLSGKLIVGMALYAYRVKAKHGANFETQNHLGGFVNSQVGGPHNLIQKVWGEAWEFAFITNSQAMPLLLGVEAGGGRGVHTL